MAMGFLKTHPLTLFQPSFGGDAAVWKLLSGRLKTFAKTTND